MVPICSAAAPTARTPSARAVATGYVEGHRLSFDKVSTDGSGKCTLDATRNPADRVYGVVFSIADEEAAELDRFEGLGHGYRKDDILVQTPPLEMPALTYVATDGDPARLPYDWYKALVLQGAVDHDLPPDYVQRIRAVNSQQDPNPERRRQNESLLRSPLSDG